MKKDASALCVLAFVRVFHKQLLTVVKSLIHGRAVYLHAANIIHPVQTKPV